jgi:hypothetical protein
MNEHTGGRRPPRGRGRLTALAPGALAAAALAGITVLAACGSSSPVASARAHPGQLTAQTLATFAACMRSHGVPDFYFSRITSSTGSALTSVIEFGPWMAPADPSSPRFQAAWQACKGG